MLKAYREANAPPDARAPALKPKLRSWTGRVWRWHPQGYQLMLKIDASVVRLGHRGRRIAQGTCALRRASFELRLYLDHSAENRLPLPWAVGAFNVESGNKTFARFYDFLETPPASVLLNLLPLAGAQLRPDLRCHPYSVEKNWLFFAIPTTISGFHNRISC